MILARSAETVSIVDGFGGTVPMMRPQDSDAYIFRLAEETDNVVHRHLNRCGAARGDASSAAPAALRELPAPLDPVNPSAPDDDSGGGPTGVPTGSDYDPSIDGWHVYDDFSGDDGNAMSDDIAPLRKWGNCFAKAEDELEFGLSETLDIGKTRIVWWPSLLWFGAFLSCLLWPIQGPMKWTDPVAWALVSVQLVFSLLMGYTVLLLRVAYKLDPRHVEAEADEKFTRQQERRARREKLEDMGESTSEVDREEEAEREAEHRQPKYLVWPLKRPVPHAESGADAEFDQADPKQAQARAVSQQRRHSRFLRLLFWARVTQYLVASLFLLVFIGTVRAGLEREGLCDLTDGVVVEEDVADAVGAAPADLHPFVAYCFFGIRGQLFLCLTIQGLVLPFIFRIPSYCHVATNTVFFVAYCALLLPLSQQPFAGIASSAVAFLLWMLTVHCLLLIDERNRRLAFRESRIAAFHRAGQEVFVSHLTHELRNPLMSLQGEVRELDLEVERQVHDRVVSEMNQNVTHMLELMTTMLDVNKLRAGRMELNSKPFSLLRVMHASLQMQRARAEERGVGLHLEVCEQVPFGVEADELRIKQCMINYLSNALKFTKAGGVLLRVRRSPLEASAERRHSSNTLLLRFEVADSGEGVPPDRAKELFRAYSQGGAEVAAKHGGTGLGLNIVKMFAARYQGDVGLVTQMNKGTVFFFDAWLPACTNASASGLAAETPVKSPVEERYEVDGITPQGESEGREHAPWMSPPSRACVLPSNVAQHQEAGSREQIDLIENLRDGDVDVANLRVPDGAKDGAVRGEGSAQDVVGVGSGGEKGDSGESDRLQPGGGGQLGLGAPPRAPAEPEGADRYDKYELIRSTRHFASRLPTRLRVLVVDDSSSFTRWAKRLLSRCSISMEAAETQDDAIRLFNPTKHDIVVLDVRKHYPTTAVNIMRALRFKELVWRDHLRKIKGIRGLNDAERRFLRTVMLTVAKNQLDKTAVGKIFAAAVREGLVTPGWTNEALGVIPEEQPRTGSGGDDQAVPMSPGHSRTMGSGPIHYLTRMVGRGDEERKGKGGKSWEAGGSDGNGGAGAGAGSGSPKPSPAGASGADAEAEEGELPAFTVTDKAKRELHTLVRELHNLLLHERWRAQRWRSPSIIWLASELGQEADAQVVYRSEAKLEDWMRLRRTPPPVAVPENDPANLRLEPIRGSRKEASLALLGDDLAKVESVLGVETGTLNRHCIRDPSIQRMTLVSGVSSRGVHRSSCRFRSALLRAFESAFHSREKPLGGPSLGPTDPSELSDAMEESGHPLERKASLSAGQVSSSVETADTEGAAGAAAPSKRDHHAAASSRADGGGKGTIAPTLRRIFNRPGGQPGAGGVSTSESASRNSHQSSSTHSEGGQEGTSATRGRAGKASEAADREEVASLLGQAFTAAERRKGAGSGGWARPIVDVVLGKPVDIRSFLTALRFVACRHRVVIAEDTTSVGRTVHRQLTREGHLVSVHERGEEVVSLGRAARHVPRWLRAGPDVILLDRGLKDELRGPDVTRLLRTAPKSRDMGKECLFRGPVLGMSGASEASADAEAFAAGLDGNLGKPVTAAVLRTSVPLLVQEDLLHRLGEGGCLDTMRMARLIGSNNGKALEERIRVLKKEEPNGNTRSASKQRQSLGRPRIWWRFQHEAAAVEKAMHDDSGWQGLPPGSENSNAIRYKRPTSTLALNRNDMF